MSKNLYPASPNSVPENLVQIPESYKWRVFYVLVAIILFVLLYLAMIAGALWVCYWMFIYEMPHWSIWTGLLKLGSMGFGVMLVLFTVKFLFKKTDSKNPMNMELKEKDHPKLFGFIRELCKEVGSPFPKKIIVNDQINAAVFYNNPILSMFLPIRKNLLIGLGLVNTLNLTEFKAVLAHEFGHFSQRSMKLGSYVYMTNRIIYDMVYSRDKWDDMLVNWSNSDIRIAVFGWLLTAVTWVIRHLLGLVYQGINLVHASLSRQMEFNADLVAVSVTGSDAIINGLSKITHSSYAMNMALNQLNDAADHKLYSDNLFFHQTIAEDYLKSKGLEHKPVVGEDGITYIFKADENEIPGMYASHPTNYDRERNAKAVYVEGIEDKRSPWILFGEAENLKKTITAKLYEQSSLKPKSEDLQPAEKINEFIQAEIAETSFDEKYFGAYDNRIIHLQSQEEVTKAALENYPDKTTTKAAYENLFNSDLEENMKKRNHFLEELNQLRQIAQTLKKRGTFEFRGKQYKQRELEKIYLDTDKEMGDHWRGWFKEFDYRVQQIHWAMVLHSEPTLKKAYAKRTEFQAKVQELSMGAKDAQFFYNEKLTELIQKGNLEPAEVTAAEHDINEFSYRKIQYVLEEAKKLEIPEMEHMKDSKNLHEFLMDGKTLIRGGRNILGQVWIQNYTEQMNTIVARLDRLYSKSLGSWVRENERIAEVFLGE